MFMILLSEAKKQLDQILNESNKKLRPFFITDEDNSFHSWVISNELMEKLLENLSCCTEIEKESNMGFWTAYVHELDVWGRGNTVEEAVDDLVSAVQDYMEVFLDNVPFFLGAGRKEHLPYIFRVLFARGSREKIKEFLGVQSKDTGADLLS